MCSGGGYYVGTSYKDPEYNFYAPGTRETGYYSSTEDAATALERIKNGNYSEIRWNP